MVHFVRPYVYVCFQRCGTVCSCGLSFPRWFSTCQQFCSPSPHCASTKWLDSCPSPSSSWPSWDQYVGGSSPVSHISTHPCTVCGQYTVRYLYFDVRWRLRGWKTCVLLSCFQVLPSQVYTRLQGREWCLLRLLFSGLDSHSASSSSPSSGSWPLFSSDETTPPHTHSGPDAVCSRHKNLKMMSFLLDGPGREQVLSTCVWTAGVY